MESAVTIGLDLGKSVFQVHGVDAGGAVVVQRDIPADAERAWRVLREAASLPGWDGGVQVPLGKGSAS